MDGFWPAAGPHPGFSMSTDAPLRVLLFAGRFEVRGSSAYTLRLAAGLSAAGVEATIVTPSARLVEPERRARLSIREYPNIGFPLWGRVVMSMMLHDLEDDPPDLIHVQSRNVLYYGQWLARQLERPLVITVHDYLQPRERLRLNRRLGRRLIAVSESVRSELEGRVNLAPDRIVVINSGVETPDDLDAPPVLDPGRAPVVGTAGPLEAVKGFPFFLGAAQKVLAVRNEVQFLMAGAGPEEGNLRRLVRELGIAEKVTFVPNLLEFSHSLRAMDIFCLPSLKQGLGTIMLEAMALARPVIATGVGGVYSAVRDNETGLLVPPSNSARLAERILELLGDPVRARALGEAGRQLVRCEFNIAQMVRRTADLYRDVVTEPEVGDRKQASRPANAGVGAR